MAIYTPAVAFKNSFKVMVSAGITLSVRVFLESHLYRVKNINNHYYYYDCANTKFNCLDDNWFNYGDIL